MNHLFILTPGYFLRGHDLAALIQGVYDFSAIEAAPLLKKLKFLKNSFALVSQCA
jgi:hypothetical protein